MTWEEATIPMKDYGSLPTLQVADEYCNQIYSTDTENEVTTRMMQILDAKYEKADLAKVVAESKHLTKDKQSKLLACLQGMKKLPKLAKVNWVAMMFGGWLEPQCVHESAFENHFKTTMVWKQDLAEKPKLL